jgi:hypothetical protein
MEDGGGGMGTFADQSRARPDLKPTRSELMLVLPPAMTGRRVEQQKRNRCADALFADSAAACCRNRRPTLSRSYLLRLGDLAVTERLREAIAAKFAVNAPL